MKPGLPRSAHRSLVHAVGALATASVLGLLAAPAVLAHGGEVPAVPPDPAILLLGWSGDPLVWLPAVVALVLWRTGVRRVNRAHPGNPVPQGADLGLGRGRAGGPVRA